MIRITPAQPWEAHYVASYLRPEDEAEVWAASRKKPAQVVPEALRLSKYCYSIRREVGGELHLNPCALFGVCDDPSNPGWGLVWLLATPELSKAAKSLMKVAPWYLDFFSWGYQCGLHTLSDSRNALHQRWLLRNRFDLIDTFTHSDVLFNYYQRPTCPPPYNARNIGGPSKAAPHVCS